MRKQCMNGAFCPLYSAHMWCYSSRVEKKKKKKKKKMAKNANIGLEMQIQTHTQLNKIKVRELKWNINQP